MKRQFFWYSLALAMGLTGQSLAIGPTVELLANGNFESDSFASWATMDLPAVADGAWFISTPGGLTPLSDMPTAANAAGGTSYAVTDQTGPGTHVLYQSFTVPPNAVSVMLSYEMFVNDADGGPIIDPAGLDHDLASNQHSRVDILYDGAAPFSTIGLDVAANYYLSVDPQLSNPNPYTFYSHDVTSIVSPGSTYMLRFAEVDNLGFLNMGVDNVSIVATLVPEPSTVILISWISFVCAMRVRRLAIASENGARNSTGYW